MVGKDEATWVDGRCMTNNFLVAKYRQQGAMQFMLSPTPIYKARVADGEQSQSHRRGMFWRDTWHGCKHQGPNFLGLTATLALFSAKAAISSKRSGKVPAVPGRGGMSEG